MSNVDYQKYIFDLVDSITDTYRFDGIVDKKKLAELASAFKLERLTLEMKEHFERARDVLLQTPFLTNAMRECVGKRYIIMIITPPELAEIQIYHVNGRVDIWRVAE